ncbi:TonB C-terminal domain-containing protein [Candidatus Dependentiae bacterium]|nr:TonB C-terminal domain-containing protein [Candidatus Dependentiae bacterium]
MWHWQHKNEYPKIVLWAKLAGISCLLHVCIVGYLLMWYHDHDAYHITLHASRISSETPVVFLPLYKRMQKPVNTTRTTSAQQTPHSASKKTSQASSPTVRSAASVHKTTTLASSSIDTQKTQKKQRVEKKKKQIAPVKKTTEQVVSKIADQRHTQTSTEKKMQSSSPKTKNTQPKTAQSQAIEQKKLTQQESISSVKQETTSVPATSAATIVTNSNDDPQPVYVGQEEWYALQIQRAIEDEITQHWRVPHGLSSDLSCQIAATVDWQGNVQQVRIAQSSGVLAYDISARSAATRMQLPALARGKEFIITFKQ